MHSDLPCRMPAINVIVPCFNHVNYIRECILSLSVSYKGKMHIVVCDDKSTDESFKIACETLQEISLNNPLISYDAQQNSENKGVSAVLNHCLKFCNNEFVYLIASDDSVIEGALNAPIELLIKTGADAVISDCKIIDENSNVHLNSAFFDYRKTNIDQLVSEHIGDELVFNWTVPGPALILKRTVYEKIGYYNENIRAEDRDFYLRLLSKCRVIFNKKPIANYRVHSENFSRSPGYLSGAAREFALVNYAHRNEYKGLSKLYLMTYKLDLISGAAFFAKYSRKIIKSFYVLKVKLKVK